MAKSIETTPAPDAVLMRSSLFDALATLDALQDAGELNEGVEARIWEEIAVAAFASTEKIDGYAYVISRLLTEADAADAEAASIEKRELSRLKARAERVRAHAARLSSIALGTMRNLKVSELNGTTATLKAYKVPDSAMVIDESAIPAEFFHTITRVETKLDKYDLLAALKEPCAACQGSGIGKSETTEVENCHKCRGTGKRQIPGAQLVTDKRRMVIK